MFNMIANMMSPYHNTGNAFMRSRGHQIVLHAVAILICCATLTMGASKPDPMGASKPAPLYEVDKYDRATYKIPIFEVKINDEEQDSIEDAYMVCTTEKFIYYDAEGDVQMSFNIKECTIKPEDMDPFTLKFIHVIDGKEYEFTINELQEEAEAWEDLGNTDEALEQFRQDRVFTFETQRIKARRRQRGHNIKIVKSNKNLNGILEAGESSIYEATYNGNDVTQKVKELVSTYVTCGSPEDWLAKYFPQGTLTITYKGNERHFDFSDHILPLVESNFKGFIQDYSELLEKARIEEEARAKAAHEDALDKQAAANRAMHDAHVREMKSYGKLRRRLLAGEAQ